MDKHFTPALLLAFLVALLLISPVAIAQNSQPAVSSVPGVDQRIVDAYGVDWVIQAKATTPYQLDYLAYACDNGQYVSWHPSKDDYEPTSIASLGKNTMNLSEAEIPDFDPENFNILLYNFVRHYDKRAIYRIDGTEQVVILLSTKELMAKYQAEKGGDQ